MRSDSGALTRVEGRDEIHAEPREAFGFIHKETDSWPESGFDRWLVRSESGRGRGAQAHIPICCSVFPQSKGFARFDARNSRVSVLDCGSPPPLLVPPREDRFLARRRLRPSWSSIGGLPPPPELRLCVSASLR